MEIDFAALNNVLQDFAKDMADNYREHLEHSGRYTTERGLIDSVSTKVVAGDKMYKVTMDVREYWKYVEADTRPHWPPPSAILRWIEIKPILPRPDSRGIKPTNKQLAYLIGRKIATEGTKGSHDLKVTRDNLIAWYRPKIAEALGHDMKEYIHNVITG